MYFPLNPAVHLPAVVVCHGYLANLAFVEIPWAADLTRLGVAALFIDRRGHGGSGGNWWPATDAIVDPEHLEPDLAAAIGYLRSRTPLIDPTRLAILGHSDGGTAAITAASWDWDVRATVALSASVAPWHYVNHIAPQNLLLVYGEDDRFVLNDTDHMLIASSTRGYLNGPGRIGRVDDGSARRLVRVGGRGHVGLLHSEAARRETLEWLRQALGARGDVSLSPLRTVWVGAGAIALLVALAARRALPEVAVSVRSSTYVRRQSVLSLVGRYIVFVGIWTAGLLTAPRLSGHLQVVVPAQEGSVVAALLIVRAAGLTLCGAACSPIRQRAITALRGMAGRSLAPFFGPRGLGRGGQLVREAADGVLVGAGILAALQVLLAHFYAMPLSRSRLGLFGVFASLALPTFAVVETWLDWIAPASKGQALVALVLVAGVTALMAGTLFERMAALPVYLFAAALVFLGAYHIGCPGKTRVGPPLMASLLMGRAASAVCALY